MLPSSVAPARSPSNRACSAPTRPGGYRAQFTSATDPPPTTDDSVHVRKAPHGRTAGCPVANASSRGSRDRATPPPGPARRGVLERRAARRTRGPPGNGRGGAPRQSPPAPPPPPPPLWSLRATAQRVACRKSGARRCAATPWRAVLRARSRSGTRRRRVSPAAPHRAVGRLVAATLRCQVAGAAPRLLWRKERARSCVPGRRLPRARRRGYAQSRAHLPPAAAAGSNSTARHLAAPVL